MRPNSADDASPQNDRAFIARANDRTNFTIAKVGLFRIKSEGSVASGVRRIEAITGKQTLAEIRRNQERIVRVAQMLKTTQAELESKLEAQIGELKDIKAKLEKFKEEASLGEARSFLTAAKTVGSLKVITAQRDGIDPNAMRKLGASCTREAVSPWSQ